MSLLFSPGYLSPINPLSPVSEVKITPYSTQITTTNFLTPYPGVTLDFDTGLNSSYIAQKDITEYLWYRILDKWLYSEDMCYLLKYLKITNGVVSPISSSDDYKNNKICNDSVEDIEKKSDYIQDNILTKKEMKKLLQRMITELDYKWYQLPQKEYTVVDVVERFLKRQLSERVGTK